LALAAAVLLAVAASAPRLASPSIATAASCNPQPHAPGDFNISMTSGGIARTYRLHVPPGYNGVTGLPVVLNFHGLGSNIVEQVILADLNPRADAQTFIVATPQGIPTSLGQPHWNITMGPPGTYSADDVLFTSDMLADIASRVCIDVARVYSTGMSNGGMMSVRLACSLSSRIAAIAPVTGVYYPPLTPLIPSETCPDTRPVPVIAFHGTADASVPFNGGAGTSGLIFRDIDDEVIPEWAAHNGCTTGPATTLAAPGVDLIEYSGCVDSATVQLYAVWDWDGDGPETTGGTHNWPGSPYSPPGNTQEIDATDLMLAFMFQFTTPCASGDADCDAVPDTADNCGAAYNPGQNNNDRDFIELGPTKAFDDLTRPNSDALGDACDPDDDNDGLTDADELTGAACGGIITDPLKEDTDGDRVLDGAECAIGTDPTNAASFPSAAQCGATTDPDGDGVATFREYCYFNTDPNNANTDGDACDDGKEIASINADLAVNVIDLSQVAGAFGPAPGPPYIVQFDVNKDGAINVLDLSFVAGQFGNC
jgi:polyhydroxybutyrate depolymerase